MMMEISISPFSSLKSSIPDAVCLPCTDGTFMQLDFCPSGPQIVQLTEAEDSQTTVVKSIEADPETFKEMFKPFFFQDAEDSGMDKEIFNLIKLNYCNWCMYQIANRSYIRAMSRGISEEEK